MLREIGRELSLSVSTVKNRYRSAFRYIVGHDYRPELWMRLFGLIKISEIFDPVALPRLATRRPVRTPQKREVPETTLAPNRQDVDRTGFLESQSVPQDQLESVDQMLDIQELMSQGRSDEEIQETLELKTTDLIGYIRQRHDEGL